MAYLAICCVFIERNVLLEVMFHLRVYIIEGHVLLFEVFLLGYMFYRRAYLTGQFVIQGDTFNWRVCPIRSHVLHEGMSCRSLVELFCRGTCKMSGHVLFKHMK